jgi:ABC-type sugar transport system permease subunit
MKERSKLSTFFYYKIRPFLTKVKKFIFKYTGISFISKKFRQLPKKTRRAITGYIFILPFIIGFFLFGLRPIYNSIKMALSDFAGSKIIDGSTKFIIEGFGFSQFKQIFTENPNHVEAILGVLGDLMIVVPLVLVFSLILALLVNKKLKGIKIFRTIFFIPVILLSGNLIRYFQNYNLLDLPGLRGGAMQEMVQLYIPGNFSNIIVSAFDKVVLILWLGGVQTLIFLAGLQKTDKLVYEAAAIDGATGWEMFWKITFPSLIPLMMINIVYTTVIYASLGNPLISAISQATVGAEYGRDYASALAWILFAIEILVIGIYLLVLYFANKRYE